LWHVQLCILPIIEILGDTGPKGKSVQLEQGTHRSLFSRRVTELKGMYGKNTRVCIESVVLGDHIKCHFLNQEVGYFERTEAGFRLGDHIA